MGDDDLGEIPQCSDIVKVGNETRERGRPGQDDPSSKPVDGQKPPPKTEKASEEVRAPRSSDPGPFAPR